MVGPGPQLGRDPVPLGAEGQQGVVGQDQAADVLALRVERVHGPGRELVQLQPVDGRGVVQPGPGTDHVGVPGVEVAAGHHTGGAEARREADDGSDVAEVARVVEQYDGRGAGRPREGGPPCVPVGPHGEGRDPGGVHPGQQPLELPPAHEPHDRFLHVGRELGGEGPHPLGLLGHDGHHLGPEPQGVLQRMEPVEHHNVVPPGILAPLPHHTHTPTLRPTRHYPASRGTIRPRRGLSSLAGV
ncbi:hypothetical protein VR44_00630 [Streptomyces katrae]|uniref:Uncharacterized protein n=1 Tax=Streptomyces katrae TaxID=68223 RepID=A0A0F4K012_9ACTN|nr:hypothetical protein VR44_00630 [Streptomyces katrae]